MIETPVVAELTSPHLPYAVRTFADGKLRADIDAALGRLHELKPNATTAVIVQVDMKNAKVVLSRNKGPWTISAIAEYDWQTRDLSAGAEVIWAI